MCVELKITDLYRMFNVRRHSRARARTTHTHTCYTFSRLLDTNKCTSAYTTRNFARAHTSFSQHKISVFYKLLSDLFGANMADRTRSIGRVADAAARAGRPASRRACLRCARARTRQSHTIAATHCVALIAHRRAHSETDAANATPPPPLLLLHTLAAHR